MLLIGVVLFGIGGVMTYRQTSFESQGVQVQGEVISLSQSCDDEGCAYRPVVSFKTQSGVTITFSSPYSSSPPDYDTGQIVTVIYSTENPNEAIIKGEGHVLNIVFLLLGGVVIISGMVMFLLNMRSNFLSG